MFVPFTKLGNTGGGINLGEQNQDINFRHVKFELSIRYPSRDIFSVLFIRV